MHVAEEMSYTLFAGHFDSQYCWLFIKKPGEQMQAPEFALLLLAGQTGKQFPWSL